MEVTLAEKTIIDKMIEEGGARRVFNRPKAIEEANRLLSIIKREYSSNIAEFDEALPPVIIVRLSRGIVYIVVLEERHVLSGVESVHIIEGLLPYLEKLKEAKKNPVLLFYSKKGKLTMAAYLYLGSVIENHGVGILFVNGGPDEILEILWHLDNAGRYEAREEDVVEL